MEMIIYGCITEKLDRNEIEDQILNKSNIPAKSLPGHENVGLRKKGIKTFVKKDDLLRHDIIQN